MAVDSSSSSTDGLSIVLKSLQRFHPPISDLLANVGQVWFFDLNEETGEWVIYIYNCSFWFFFKFLNPHFFFIFLTTFSSYGQLGHEWIQFGHPYFKIPVAQDGIYRLSVASLIAAGFPAHTEANKIQLFHRGKEQRIYVHGDADGQFDNTDFIEFYGIEHQPRMFIPPP